MTSRGLCPCGSGRNYDECCGRYHVNGEVAPNAEALMRSRYSAYALGFEDYLRATWHPATCPATLDLDIEPRPQWLGLTVKSFRPVDDAHATVEFVARYKISGRAHRLHEVSRFECIDGHWLYRDGEINE